MTFAEVPIGHLFRLRHFNGRSCSCFIRKTGHHTYQYVTACEIHTLQAHGGTVRVLTDPTTWNVDYDPFVAELEQL